MKNWLLMLLFSSSIVLLAGEVERRMLFEFLPIAREWNAGQEKEALTKLEKLAPDNSFAASMLILVYSRGYGDREIDYRKVAGYWEMLEKLGSRYRIELPFLDEERENVEWYEPRADCRELPFGLKFDAHNRRYDRTMISLRGIYPLRKCYFDQVRICGANVPGMMLLMTRYRSSEPERSMLLEEECKLGGAVALADRALKVPSGAALEYVPQKITAADFALLTQAAASNCIPVLLICGQILRQNQSGIPVDLLQARRYFTAARDRLLEVKATGCKHGDKQFLLAERMLKLTPDPSWSRKELEAARAAAVRVEGFDPKFFDDLIARKSPSYAKYLEGEGLLFKDRAKAMVLLKEAADAGETAALSRVIFEVRGKSPDAWYWLYLAGRNGMQSPEKMSYYQQATIEAMNNRHRMKPEEYRKALTLLSEYDGSARRMLAMLDQEPKPVAAPAELELKFDERLFSLSRKDGGGIWQCRFIAKVAIPQTEIRLRLPESMQAGMEFEIACDPALQAKLRGALLVRRGGSTERMPIARNTLFPSGAKTETVEMTVGGLRNGDAFELILRNPAKMNGVVDSGRTVTPDDQAIFTLPSSDRIAIHGIDEELCRIRESAGRVVISIMALDEPLEGKLVLVFPASGKYDEVRIPPSMSGRPAGAPEFRVTAYLRNPDSVVDVPAMSPRPTVFGSPLKALAVKFKLNPRKGFSIPLEGIR